MSTAKSRLAGSAQDEVDRLLLKTSDGLRVIRIVQERHLPFESHIPSSMPQE